MQLVLMLSFVAAVVWGLVVVALLQSPKYKHWLAMPEMMHVGSLIVDDIQDKSEIRRGGPSCHIVHGDAIAINGHIRAQHTHTETNKRGHT